MIVKWEEEAVDDGTSWEEEEERLRSQMTTQLQLVMTLESHSAADDCNEDTVSVRVSTVCVHLVLGGSGGGVPEGEGSEEEGAGRRRGGRVGGGAGIERDTDGDCGDSECLQHKFSS